MHENPYKPAAAVIKKIKKNTYDTTTYTLSFDDPKVSSEYSFQPGQFNMLTLFGIGEAPISISSDAEEDTFNHTIRHVGNVTHALAKLKEGDKVWVRGPYGNGWPVNLLNGKNVLVVAGGIGLAPLRPVVTQLVKYPEKYGKVEILYGARTPADMLYTDEFEDWRKSLKLYLTVDMVPDGSQWNDQVGVVTTLFNAMETKPANTIVLTCGPEIMMKFVVKGLLERGFTPEQLYVSLERRMSCGIKKCGNCQIGSKFVCQDGPVFAFAELLVLPEDILGGVGR
jgi:sulfite reductase subunit B